MLYVRWREGGVGSGNYGHAGRKGLIGGSSSNSGGLTIPTKQEDDAIMQWKAGKEYYHYFLHKDVGKEDQYRFTGNDLLVARKKEHADVLYSDLNQYLDKAKPYTGSAYRFARKDSLHLLDNGEIFIATKASWTKHKMGKTITTSATEGGLLLSIKTGNKLMHDITPFGGKNFMNEREVLSQKGLRAKITSKKDILISGVGTVTHLELEPL